MISKNYKCEAKVPPKPALAENAQYTNPHHPQSKSRTIECDTEDRDASKVVACVAYVLYCMY